MALVIVTVSADGEIPMFFFLYCGAVSEHRVVHSMKDLHLSQLPQPEKCFIIISQKLLVVAGAIILSFVTCGPVHFSRLEETGCRLYGRE